MKSLFLLLLLIPMSGFSKCEMVVNTRGWGYAAVKLNGVAVREYDRFEAEQINAKNAILSSMIKTFNGLVKSGVCSNISAYSNCKIKNCPYPYKGGMTYLDGELVSGRCHNSGDRRDIQREYQRAIKSLNTFMDNNYCL